MKELLQLEEEEYEKAERDFMEKPNLPNAGIPVADDNIRHGRTSYLKTNDVKLEGVKVHQHKSHKVSHLVSSAHGEGEEGSNHYTYYMKDEEEQVENEDDLEHLEVPAAMRRNFKEANSSKYCPEKPPNLGK